jgi:hypothetical protein
VFDAIVSRIGGVVPHPGFPLTGRARVLRRRADRERAADVNLQRITLKTPANGLKVRLGCQTRRDAPMPVVLCKPAGTFRARRERRYVISLPKKPGRAVAFGSVRG